MSMKSGIKQYRQIGVQAAVFEAGPHDLITMLLDGALSAIAAAKGLMQRGDIAGKGSRISAAIDIVEGLRASLDKGAGGEIAENLEELYGYMEQRLLKANIANDVVILDEVSGLLREIKSGWTSIPQEFREMELPQEEVIAAKG